MSIASTSLTVNDLYTSKDRKNERTISLTNVVTYKPRRDL